MKWYFAYSSNMDAARLFEGRLKLEAESAKRPAANGISPATTLNIT